MTPCRRYGVITAILNGPPFAAACSTASLARSGSTSFQADDDPALKLVIYTPV
jgi:hypothetical protein